MAPIRVLQVMPAMDAGGMETFVMNVYRTIDRTQVQFDFLYHYNKPCFYDDEIAALGGRITKLTVRQDNNIPRYLRQLDGFFAANPYRIIHGHYSGFGMFYNRAAKRRGVPVRVGHSHNTAYEPNLVGTLDRLMSSRFDRLLTDRFACSQKAGEMLFGKSPFTVLPNGIRVDDFAKPEPGARERIRAQWQVPDGAPLLGHVGRFSKQKNHLGLLDIFAAVHRRDPDARLALLGAGPLEGEVRARADALGLADRVIFAGVRSDTAACYAAMDAFLLPSLFEGLPVVLVEAQSTWTVNIIVRGLLYLTRSYQDYLKRTGQNLHGSRRVELPRPEIYVIYTGERKSRPEKLLLSQEFFGGEEGAVEVRVQMIYDGEEGDIISQYVSFTKVLKEQVRRWGRTKEAVKETIRICKDQEILEEYLAEREEEVISIMADLFDDDETIFNMFVESEKRQAAKKAERRAERRTQRRMEKQAVAKDRRTAQRMYGLGTSVDNIAMVLDVPVKIVEKWLGLAEK